MNTVHLSADERLFDQICRREIADFSAGFF